MTTRVPPPARPLARSIYALARSCGQGRRDRPRPDTGSTTATAAMTAMTATAAAAR